MKTHEPIFLLTQNVMLLHIQINNHTHEPQPHTSTQQPSGCRLCMTGVPLCDEFALSLEQ